MKIEKVILKNFRSYKNYECAFNKGWNIIVGPNGSGKTNIVESIYTCAFSKSFKKILDKDLLNFNSTFYYLNLLFSDDFSQHTIEISYSEKTGKHIKYDAEKLKNFSEIIGKIYVILYYPDDINIIKGSPDYRRKFLDVYLSQINSNYLTCLRNYRYYLKLRNLLLKQRRSKDKLFSFYSRKYVEYGTKVVFERLQFIKQMNVILRESFSSDSLIELQYKVFKNVVTMDEIEFRLSEMSRNSMKKEERYGYTCVGPHIDDINILFNKKNSRLYSSYGEQKIASIYLKLALYNYYFKHFNINPVLLLDDILSELDHGHRKFLFSKLFGCKQIILTTTDKPDPDILENYSNYIFTK